MTKNQIDYKNAVESERWHQATERETERHNREDEKIRNQANILKLTELETNRMLAEEQIRHNKVNEWLTEQFNASQMQLHRSQMNVNASQALLNRANTQRSYAEAGYTGLQAQLTAKYGEAERQISIFKDYKSALRDESQSTVNWSQTKLNEAQRDYVFSQQARTEEDTKYREQQNRWFLLTDVLPSFASSWRDFFRGEYYREEVRSSRNGQLFGGN